MQPQQAKAAMTLLCLFAGTEVDATPTDWSLTRREENRGRELGLSEIAISEPVNEDSEWGMCGGVDDTDVTTVYYGPCNTTSEAPPLGYYKNEVVALAIVEGGDTAYLNSSDLVTLLTASEVGARISGSKNIGDAEVGFASASAAYGDCSSAGAAMGTTSYLTLGGNATVTENTVLLQGFELNATVDSVTYSPGSYKFSLYGGTCGDNYAGVVEGHTHLGFRTKVSQQGCDSADGCTWNVRVKQASSSTYQDFPAAGESITDVEAIEVVASDAESDLSWTMDITYPRTYRYGYIHIEEDNSYSLVDEGSGSMSLSMTTENGFVYLDYVFPLTHLNESHQYFIYDPEVTARAASPDEFPTDNPTELNTASMGFLQVTVAVTVMIMGAIL